MSTSSTTVVEVRVPAMLRAATAGARAVRAEGETVREVLADLTRRYPGFGAALFEADGELRRFVNVYLNDEDVRYLGGLEAMVRDGETVSILPAVAGGAREPARTNG